MGAARSAPPTPLADRYPFKQTARGYFEAGWLPMPIRAGEKDPPPTGFTGWTPKKRVTISQLTNWEKNAAAASNIAARPADDYIGIDVDIYKSEEAKEQWAAIIEEMGELPETWTSSARDDGSGIRHFRVPEEYIGLRWPGTVGDVIQFCHIGHRYPMLPPSVHPSKELFDEDGNPAHYRWYAPGEEADGDGIVDGSFPAYDELPLLPEEWILYFTNGEFAKHLPEKDLGSPSKAKKFVDTWIAERDGEPCDRMLRVYDEVLEQFDANAAHDTMSQGFWRLAAVSCEGHAGLSTVTSRLREDFLTEVKREGRGHTARGAAEAEEEWLRARDAAVKKILIRVEKHEFVGHFCECGELDPDGNPKPRVDINNYNPNPTMLACYQAIAANPQRGGYGVYRTGRQLKLLSDDGLEDLDRDTLRAELSDAVEFIRWGGGDEPKPIPAMPPKDLMDTMLKDRRMVGVIPEIYGLAKSPFWANVDGKAQLVHENGYHAGSKVFMRMDPRLLESVEKMDLSPSKTWVARAKQIVEEMICKFPFVGQADRAAFYAGLILPFARDLINGPTPLHLVSAHAPGTGKTLLTDAIAMVACDVLTPADGYFQLGVGKEKERDAELSKFLDGAMQDDPRVIIIDNIKFRFDSPKLASMLTAYPTYTGRVMGGNKVFTAANRAVWFATANNLKASEEINSRIVACNIDAKVERPRERQDDFLALYDWVPANRHRLVWAVLTLIANWVAQGQPDGKERMGSYDAWVKVMGGILATAGIRGLLTNRDAFMDAANDDFEAMDGVVQQWATRIKPGERSLPAEMLATIDAFQDLFDVHGPNATKLAKNRLDDVVGKVISGWTVGKATKDGRDVYYLVPKDGVLPWKRRPRRPRGARK